MSPESRDSRTNVGKLGTALVGVAEASPECPFDPYCCQRRLKEALTVGINLRQKETKKKISYLSNETLIEMTKEASIYLLELQKRYLNIAVSSKFINNKPKIFSVLWGDL